MCFDSNITQKTKQKHYGGEGTHQLNKSTADSFSIEDFVKHYKIYATRVPPIASLANVAVKAHTCFSDCLMVLS